MPQLWHLTLGTNIEVLLTDNTVLWYLFLESVKAAIRASHPWVYIMVFRKTHLSPESVKAYLFGLNHIQKLWGTGIPALHSPVIYTLLTGDKYIQVSCHIAKKCQPITFLELQTIWNCISRAAWNHYNKVAIWTCFLVAFFGSFQLGELLRKKNHDYSTRHHLCSEKCSKTNAWSVNPSSEIFLSPRRDGNNISCQKPQILSCFISELAIPPTAKVRTG
jgi:hypothetical protein